MKDEKNSYPAEKEIPAIKMTEELHERLKLIIYRKTSEGIDIYYDLKTQVPEIIIQEFDRRMKQYDKCKSCCKWKVGCYEG